MHLFEQKFKRFLTEGDRVGYPDLSDEDAFLGYNIYDSNIGEYFPEIQEFIENIYASSAEEQETGLNMGNMRFVVGDDITDKFIDYATKITKINEDLYDILGTYVNYDISGIEAGADIDSDQQVKEEAFEELTSIFGESEAEYFDYDNIMLSMASYFTGDKFEPYLKLQFENTEDGEEYPMYIESTEDSYYRDFDEKVRKIKDVVSNTLNTSF